MNRLLFLIFALSFIACRKHSTTPADSYATTCPADYNGHIIAGKWRLISSWGGLTGKGPGGNPDSVYTLTYRPDGTYAFAFNGMVTRQGTYDTVSFAAQDGICYDGNTSFCINYYPGHKYDVPACYNDAGRWQ